MKATVRESSRSVRWVNALAVSCSALFNSDPTLAPKTNSVALSARAAVVIETPATRNQHPKFLDWAVAKEKEVAGRTDAVKDDWHYNQPIPFTPQTKLVARPTLAVQKRLNETSQNYFRNFGRNSVESFIWTGVEPASNLTKDEGYRWNAMRIQGLFKPENRKKLARNLKGIHARNIQLGLANYGIDLAKPETWRAHDALIKDFRKEGMKISLDVHHFGIESRFRVKNANDQTILDKNGLPVKPGETIGAESYYLHKDWPAYYATFAVEAVRRYKDDIEGLTLFREPETVVGFNGEMWHGGYPGWASPISNRIYIDRAIQLGKAAVMARIGIEKYMASLPAHERKDLTYMHMEASVYKASWPDFNAYRRFVVSDLILGHEWLMKADLEWLAKANPDELVGLWHRLRPEERTNFHWVIENALVYNVSAADRPALRDRLVRELTELRDLHRSLGTIDGRGLTMKSKTVFGVDYYAHNENLGADGVTRLSPEPQNYVSEIQAGNRGGIYNIVVDYYNRYQMPMMIGETGTPYYHYASRWNQQMMLELAHAARQGVPILGYTLYPAVDTYGWESAQALHRNTALYNPSGVTELAHGVSDPVKRKEINYTPRPSIRRFIEFLEKSFDTEVQ